MERLPERHFPLQNLELERTDLFLSRTYYLNAPHILFGSRDPGPANALLPLIRAMNNQRFNLSLFADSRAKEMFRRSLSVSEFYFYENLDPLCQLASIHPDIVMTSSLASFQPGIELTLTANAKVDNIPVIWVEDYPGEILKHHQEVGAVSWVLPNYICVANEWAKQQELKVYPNFDPNRIIVTGLPNVDRLANENREEVRNRIRGRLGIGEHERLIVYMGIPTTANVETLSVIVQALRQFTDVSFRFVNRRHPRDTQSRETYKTILQPIQRYVVDTDSLSTDEIGMAADFVVTTYSTTGIESVIRQIPTLHILIPEIMALAESSSVEDPIVVQDGASPCAHSEDEVLPLLHQLFFDRVFQSELAGKMQRWIVDGKASERIVGLIQNILKSRGVI